MVNFLELLNPVGRYFFNVNNYILEIPDKTFIPLELRLIYSLFIIFTVYLKNLLNMSLLNVRINYVYNYILKSGRTK